jgi:hypothetical protein
MTGSIRRAAGVWVVSLVVLAFSAAAETRTSKPFKGVTLHQRTESSPRPLKINVVEIDLKAAGIRFRVTPSNGDAPGETTLQTTRDFLVQQKAQLAINASFYKTLKDQYGDTAGLTASDGEAYSEFNIFPTLNLSRDNVPTFVSQKKRDQSGVKPAQNVEVFNAVSGNEFILQNGKNVAEDDRLHPRTAVGVAPNHKLVILTVDGRQQGVSEGMTTIEVANMLKEYGVTDAINLDGGGSTTLVVADPSPRVVNTPVGVKDVPGTERRNAANLAIFAEPADQK